MRVWKAMCLCLLVMLAASTGRTALADEAYHLGVALGLTGPGAPYSRDALRGIEIAVEEINAQGGLLGKHPIKLFVKNTKTRVDVAETVVKELVETDRVRAMIGTYSSAAALAIKPILRDNRVLHIATVSNSEDITKLDFSPYTYSVVPNTYMMAKAVVLGAAKLAAENGWTSYVTIASDYAWGRSSQGVQVELLKQMAPEAKLLAAYWPPLGETTFNAFVVAIRNNKPDFLLDSVAGADNAYWTRDARDYGLHKDVASPGRLISVVELIRDRKFVRRGAYGRTRAPFFAHLDVPMMAAFVEAFRAKFDRYPSDWAVMSYDGVQALKQGVEKAGGIETDPVKDALKGLAIQTTRGTLSFREIDNQLAASAYFGRVSDDPAYDFPIYADLVELKGPDLWRPEAEIRAARGQ
ncbi:MAG: ABC transporter substrate-binding protein [Alphaproteobacteria bacterium]|nr:ABC transporter substrate-binding protein [Alphaproteobacteria bacterium]